MSDDASQLGAKPSKKFTFHIKLLPVVAGVIAAALVFLYFYEFAPGLSSDRGVWGQFGDYIGGTLNPLLSFLALIAIVLTYGMQAKQLEMAQEEVKNSREELRLTRAEMERSSAAQEAAAHSVAQQAKYAAMSAKISALGAYGATLSARLATIQKGDTFGEVILRPRLKGQLEKNSNQIDQIARSIDIDS